MKPKSFLLCASAGALVGGCTIPPNTAPIALGVPDGFVLERVPLSSPSRRLRIEKVTFASQGKRHRAVVMTPLVKRKLPAAVISVREELSRLLAKRWDPHVERFPAVVLGDGAGRSGVIGGVVIEPRATLSLMGDVLDPYVPTVKDELPSAKPWQVAIFVEDEDEKIVTSAKAMAAGLEEVNPRLYLRVIKVRQ